jgi:hypothetical protein
MAGKYGGQPSVKRRFLIAVEMHGRASLRYVTRTPPNRNTPQNDFFEYNAHGAAVAVHCTVVQSCAHAR